MSDLISFNPNRALTANIGAAAAARAFFYDAGTTTLKTVYADAGLTIAHPSPLLADAGGIFAQVFTDGTPVKVVVQNAGGSTLYTLDPAPSDSATSFGSVISFDDVAALLADTKLAYGSGVYRVATGDIIRTQAEGFAYEVAASGASDQHVTTAGGVKLYVQPPYNVKAFGAIGDGVATDTTALQAAINATGRVHIPAGTYKITANLVVPSNTAIYGDGDATVIQIATNAVWAFSTGISADKTNIEIRDMLIDGGGQTSNIYTGIASARGVYLTRASKVRVSNLTIRKCGVVKSVGDPTDDGNYGGYGIYVEARYGDVTDIVIEGCRVTNIAGGGNFTGDGIAIAGFKSATSITYQNVIVRDCYVSTVGRHCYSAAGKAPESQPSGVKFVNCYGEKSALDGIDIEDANDLLISGCTFRTCGNDRTYFDPVAKYGATYRLLAAIAHGNTSVNVRVQDCTIDASYYGITFGNGSGLTLTNCTVKNSTTADIKQGLATAPSNMRMLNCSFETTGHNLLDYYSETVKADFLAQGCSFASLVRVSAMSDSGFSGCTFKAGFSMSGGSALFRRVTFDACTWLDFAGVAVLNSGSNNGHPDVTFNGCSFLGAGNMTYGIQVAFNASARWIVRNCKFVGQTTAAIGVLNGGDLQLFSEIIGNEFVNCAAGIDFPQPVNNCVIANNTFSGVTGYCIDYRTIFGSMLRVNIVNNLAASGCTNGVRISTSGGSWDYCVVALNNMNGCSGTKWSLSAGNANGHTVNNITT